MSVCFVPSCYPVPTPVRVHLSGVYSGVARRCSSRKDLQGGKKRATFGVAGAAVVGLVRPPLDEAERAPGRVRPPRLARAQRCEWNAAIAWPSPGRPALTPPGPAPPLQTLINPILLLAYIHNKPGFPALQLGNPIVTTLLRTGLACTSQVSGASLPYSEPQRVRQEPQVPQEELVCSC